MCLAALLLFPGAGLRAADGPVFKRVAAPTPGSAPKIDVQIDPDTYFDYLNPKEPPPTATIIPASLPPDASTLPFTEFWRTVETSNNAEMAQLEDALRKTGLDGPRLDDLQTIADAYGRDILSATVGTKVSPALVLAVISVESEGKPKAISHAGALGLMQLIPATAERFSVADPMEPAENIRGGVAYLDWLMDQFSANPVEVLAAYNAGENNVREYHGAPPFAETRAYVPKVLAAWQVARGLCLTPPELVSDGCVFKQREVAREG